ncbi:MAG: SPFH/Band 7/PHB domain protein [Christensenellaceae bacterium]|jgi:regulator of protease activity HflC (stomatin/prohibitin superfamily)|nr:SPFH/Band 7/PHB domain protein [Christensenellaceae bacterium]
MNISNLIGATGMSVGALILVIIGVAILLLLISNVKMVHQGTTVVVERLGKYHKTLETGLHLLVPIFDRAVRTISIKEQVVDFMPQPVITKDNVTMQIDSVVFFQVVDPKLFSYGIENPMRAIENLTATTLRNIIGELELDQTLTSRETVNERMRITIDDATNPWGIKVNRVELKSIEPPVAIKESMEKQMRAERERREAILRAEGEKKSNILVAEGEKEAAILRAEATKISLLTEAEGQAQAIKKIIDAKPNAEYLTLQGYEALKVLADGQATKIIVPNDLANVAGIFTALSETLDKKHKKA